MEPSTMQETYCHISDRLDSSAPFGRDSVPDVNIIRTGSSSPTWTYGAGPAWSNHDCASGQPVGDGSPLRPTASLVVTVPAEAASAFSATGTRASSTTKAFAVEW